MKKRAISPINTMPLLLILVSFTAASSTVPLCPLIQVNLSSEDILNMSFEDLEDSPAFREKFLTLSEQGLNDFEALSKAREELASTFINPRPIKGLVTRVEKYESSSRELFTYDDLEVITKAKDASVCTEIPSNGYNSWYRNGYYRTDYSAVSELVANKKEIWQAAYDKCALPKLKSVSNDNVFYEIVKICRRTADKKSGYKFSW